MYNVRANLQSYSILFIRRVGFNRPRFQNIAYWDLLGIFMKTIKYGTLQDMQNIALTIKYHI